MLWCVTIPLCLNYYESAKQIRNVHPLYRPSDRWWGPLRTYIRDKSNDCWGIKHTRTHIHDLYVCNLMVMFSCYSRVLGHTVASTEPREQTDLRSIVYFIHTLHTFEVHFFLHFWSTCLFWFTYRELVMQIGQIMKQLSYFGLWLPSYVETRHHPSSCMVAT